LAFTIDCRRTRRFTLTVFTLGGNSSIICSCLCRSYKTLFFDKRINLSWQIILLSDLPRLHCFLLLTLFHPNPRLLNLLFNGKQLLDLPFLLLPLLSFLNSLFLVCAGCNCVRPPDSIVFILNPLGCYLFVEGRSRQSFGLFPSERRCFLVYYLVLLSGQL